MENEPSEKAHCCSEFTNELIVAVSERTSSSFRQVSRDNELVVDASGQTSSLLRQVGRANEQMSK